MFFSPLSNVHIFVTGVDSLRLSRVMEWKVTCGRREQAYFTLFFHDEPAPLAELVGRHGVETGSAIRRCRSFSL